MRLSAVRHEPSVVLFDLDGVLIDSWSVLRRAPLDANHSSRALRRGRTLAPNSS